MIGGDRFRRAAAAAEFHPPAARLRIKPARCYAASKMDAPAQSADAFRASLPHHARPKPRIAESVNQAFHDFAAFLGGAGAESIENGRPKRQALNALRSPVGRDLAAADSPDFFRVSLKERSVKARAELVAHPVFE